ncbi:MAG: hypothetical protein HKN80_02335 [Acidimicrobiia bacterium]|nr:hypothetical protein [Acidimicrobiia bacterium]
MTVDDTTRLEAPQAPPSQTGFRGWKIAATAAASVVALIVGFVALGGGSDDVAGSAPVSVVVPGTEQWIDTGIDLSINDTVLIEADGAVTPAVGREDHYGPDGVPDRPSAHTFNVVGMKEANHNSLIGRIGEAGAPFLVGSRLLSEADAEGRLFLGMNDTGVGNNAGEFTATITVNP